MATIKDVAKQAGVAVSTASYALNGTKKMKQETKERVLQAARELQYQKNGVAMDLKKSKTKTIALILSDLTGPFYSELIRGVQEEVLEKKYDLLVCSSYGNESSTAAKFLREKRADGVILLAHNISDDFITESARTGFPIIVLDRVLPEKEALTSITVNNYKGGYEATRHLLEKGAVSAACIHGPINSSDSQERLSGYEQALQDSGLKKDSKWILNGSFTHEGGYQATKILIHQGDLPNAVFYANDEMAIGGLEALKESGLNVPEDIAIIGFDDIQLAPYLQPPLTTMRHPKYEMGKLASHVIFQVLEGQPVKSHYTLETEFINRESVSKQ
ncbi:LacI family DNA-binding transcriptional regulator [Alkalicoccus halolimnae]|jgi:LacI family transcriptional regulator|uniref:LacI family DNA-binding transcriptional regulator n=1 Tax=Alkalicoccus halolimnae TaxID=1667239 RepID=A0A5C7FG81_9BACI|nr:LacI family DNA-binding transcriptional regulator [Alkalicoccus halolimnae]TXF83596.1 LacI family transcriptional regulator [Alkalicoccus halolimnae]